MCSTSRTSCVATGKRSIAWLCHVSMGTPFDTISHMSSHIAQISTCGMKPFKQPALPCGLCLLSSSAPICASHTFPLNGGATPSGLLNLMQGLVAYHHAYHLSLLISMQMRNEVGPAICLAPLDHGLVIPGTLCQRALLGQHDHPFALTRRPASCADKTS